MAGSNSKRSAKKFTRIRKHKSSKLVSLVNNKTKQGNIVDATLHEGNGGVTFNSQKTKKGTEDTKIPAYMTPIDKKIETLYLMFLINDFDI